MTGFFFDGWGSVLAFRQMELCRDLHFQLVLLLQDLLHLLSLEEFELI
jgi:hypothetical protein